MSGGHFNYNQHKILDVADDIDHLIEHNDKEDEYGYCREYSHDTIKKFKHAEKLCREAAIYVQRIDWLVSGDDGEGTFHKRLKNDLDKSYQ